MSDKALLLALSWCWIIGAADKFKPNLAKQGVSASSHNKAIFLSIGPSHSNHDCFVWSFPALHAVYSTIRYGYLDLLRKPLSMALKRSCLRLYEVVAAAGLS